eukprot:scaffold2736_cov82-Skeletonema_dohrnii-CCMP3373.AAC.18
MMAAFALVLAMQCKFQKKIISKNAFLYPGQKLGENVVGRGKGEGRENPFQPKTNKQTKPKRGSSQQAASSRVKIDRTNKLLLASFMMMAADGWFIYNGREAVPPVV